MQFLSYVYVFGKFSILLPQYGILSKFNVHVFISIIIIIYYNRSEI